MRRGKGYLFRAHSNKGVSTITASGRDPQANREEGKAS